MVMYIIWQYVSTQKKRSFVKYIIYYYISIVFNILLLYIMYSFLLEHHQFNNILIYIIIYEVILKVANLIKYN